MCVCLHRIVINSLIWLLHNFNPLIRFLFNEIKSVSLLNGKRPVAHLYAFKVDTQQTHTHKMVMVSGISRVSTL